MAGTWLPLAIKRLGPSWKQGYPSATSRSLAQIEGEIKHSAEGSLSALFSELDRPDRTASWTFSHAKDGRLFQHYPLEAITWHAGLAGDRRIDTSLIGNATLIGEEHEGGGPGNAGEPLTEAQYETSLYVSREVRQLCPHVAINPPTLRLNLWEHNWLSWTSCPSGRIPWQRLITDLEDDMATVKEITDLLNGMQRNLLFGKDMLLDQVVKVRDDGLAHIERKAAERHKQLMDAIEGADDSGAHGH